MRLPLKVTRLIQRVLHGDKEAALVVADWLQENGIAVPIPTGRRRHVEMRARWGSLVMRSSEDWNSDFSVNVAERITGLERYDGTEMAAHRIMVTLIPTWRETYLGMRKAGLIPVRLRGGEEMGRNFSELSLRSGELTAYLPWAPRASILLARLRILGARGGVGQLPEDSLESHPLARDRKRRRPRRLLRKRATRRG